MNKFGNIVKLLVALAMVCSLVAIVAAPASAADASISIAPGSGPVGASVTVQAGDFAANSILTARFDGALVTTAPTTVQTDDNGNVTFAILIPAASAGEHEILVTDGVNTDTDTFTVVPKVRITSPATKRGPVGTTVTVAGTGFSGAGVTADVTIGGSPLASGVPVDNTGSFTATGVVPSLASGDKTVTATDGAGNVGNVTDTFTVTPTLTLSPTSGLAGSWVTVSGTGWTQGNVTLTFAGASWETVEAEDTGVIEAVSKQIPTGATAGTKTVVGTDTGSLTASTTFTVVARGLSLTPNSGPRGTTVLITGSNLTPNGTVESGDLDFNGNDWNTTDISIDSAGTLFPTTLTVPTNTTVAPLGANTVRAEDSGGLIAYGTFTVTRPTISVSPTTGSVNSSFTVSGSGWVPGARVTITLNYTDVDDQPATSDVTAIPDASGNIAASMKVPSDAKAGTHSISASDTKNNSALSVDFTVPGALITLSPTQGPWGTSVTVTGSGFNAYTAVTVSIGTYTFASQPLTNARGAFTYTFTVPGLAPGSTAVRAADGANTASAFFIIEEAAETIQEQLITISNKLVRVWGYSNGTWYMYDPADEAGSNLATLTAGKGYWINVTEDCTLIYEGYSYALTAGWNLIGWR